MERRHTSSIREVEGSFDDPPVLKYPNYEKEFIVSTDASSKALGAVLSHLDDDSIEHPIHYASRTLNDAERSYSTYDREALGVVFALKKFRQHLLCQMFLLYIDHEALKYVINMKDPTLGCSRISSDCCRRPSHHPLRCKLTKKLSSICETADMA